MRLAMLEHYKNICGYVKRFGRAQLRANAFNRPITTSWPGALYVVRIGAMRAALSGGDCQ
jgi:hypothetical protein